MQQFTRCIVGSSACIGTVIDMRNNLFFPYRCSTDAFSMQRLYGGSYSYSSDKKTIYGEFSNEKVFCCGTYSVGKNNQLSFGDISIIKECVPGFLALVPWDSVENQVVNTFPIIVIEKDANVSITHYKSLSFMSRETFFLFLQQKSIFFEPQEIYVAYRKSLSSELERMVYLIQMARRDSFQDLDLDRVISILFIDELKTTLTAAQQRDVDFTFTFWKNLGFRWIDSFYYRYNRGVVGQGYSAEFMRQKSLKSIIRDPSITLINSGLYVSVRDNEYYLSFLIQHKTTLDEGDFEAKILEDEYRKIINGDKKFATSLAKQILLAYYSRGNYKLLY